MVVKRINGKINPQGFSVFIPLCPHILASDGYSAVANECFSFRPSSRFGYACGCFPISVSRNVKKHCMTKGFGHFQG
jgi:hypothetical protein